MARKDTIIIVDFDAEPAEGTYEELMAMLSGMRNAATRVVSKIEKVFTDAGVNMAAYSREMSNGLLSLRLNLGKLKKALTDAVAPVASVVLPAINAAIRAMTSFFRSIGLVLGILFSGSQGNQALAQSAQDAAQGENQLAKAVKSAGAAAKRSLAGFDRINRLSGGGSGSGSSKLTVAEELTEVSPRLLKIAGKLRLLLKPLAEMDLEPLKQALSRLGQTLAELGGVIGAGLEDLWFQVLVPLAGWVIQEAAPATVETLTKAFRGLQQVLEPILAGLQAILPYLQPIISFIADTVILILNNLGQQLEKLGLAFQDQGGNIQQTFVGIGQIVQKVWEVIGPIIKNIRTDWLQLMDIVGSVFASCVASITHVLSGLVNFVAGVLTGDWSQAWEGLKNVVKGAVNGVIGILNGLLRGVVLVINGLVRAINGLSFRLPEWNILGDLAGQHFGLNLPSVTAPQIPYLAKGAVLPANRPFLAMVGDQRHGTNIEAPLSTIQEAVALVMEDMTASNLAGQEAILGTLRQILEAVLGIDIGDDVIGSAAERYQRKMAIVRGGYV